LLVGDKFQHAYFVESDVVSIDCRVKAQHIYSFNVGNTLVLEAPLVPSASTRSRMAKTACDHFKVANAKSPLCPLILAKLGAAEATVASFKNKPCDFVRSSAAHFERACRYNSAQEFPSKMFANAFSDLGILLGLKEGTSLYGALRIRPPELTDEEKAEILHLVNVAERHYQDWTPEKTLPPLGLVCFT
jgi:hypothetical protein